MHFNRLRELVNKLGGLLILNGDEPEFVVLSYKKYDELVSGSSSEDMLFPTSGNGFVEANAVGSDVDEAEINDIDDQNIVDRLNQEILSLKEEIRLKEEAELVENEQSTEFN